MQSAFLIFDGELVFQKRAAIVRDSDKPLVGIDIALRTRLHLCSSLRPYRLQSCRLRGIGLAYSLIAVLRLSLLLSRCFVITIGLHGLL